MKALDGKVSVIIPAHNEAGHITTTLEETVRTFDGFGCQYEIIVIDDGSNDRTYQECLEFSRRRKNIFIKKNWKNYGKGRALKKGCRYASGEYIVFLDADMDLHPAQLQTFIDIMRLDEADVVIGSKLHPNSVVNYPLHRKIVSYIYYLLIKILFSLPRSGLSLHDTQTGLKLFKRAVVKSVFPRILVKKFAFDLEFLVNAHHLGFKIAEAPVVLDSKRARRFGRIGWRAMYKTGIDTLAIFYRMYILKYYDRIDYHRRKKFKR
jgi:glycosyltransferase involved in cell wall biosynthesis